MVAATANYTTLYALVAVVVIFGASTLLLGTRGRMRSMNAKGVWGILSFTYREAIRTKWLILFGVLFFLLAVNIPNLYLAVAGNLPPEYLPANLSSLISIVFPFIPLLPLPVGAVSIVEERESGTLQYLLSNPVTKSEFFLGKAVGLLLATTTVIIIGFGGAAAVVFGLGLSAYAPIILIMLFAGLLNAIMLGVALIISELSKRKATAMGLGIMVWFLLAVVSSIDQLIIAVALKLGAHAAVLVVMLDPIETANLLSTLGAGLGAEATTNSSLLLTFVWHSSAFTYDLIDVALWIAVTFTLGFLIFRHQDAA